MRRERQRNGQLHLRPAHDPQRPGGIRLVGLPHRHIRPRVIHCVKQSIRPQRQPHRRRQTVRPLDIFLAIETQNPLPARAPKRPPFRIENQTPSRIAVAVRPRRSHRVGGFHVRHPQHVRDKIREKQPPALHRHLRKAAGRALRHIRLPRARLPIESLHHAIALTRHQQIALVPGHPRGPSQMPRLSRREVDKRAEPQPRLRVKPLHRPILPRHTHGNIQPPIRPLHQRIRCGQSADERAQMFPLRIISLHLPTVVHEHEQVGGAEARGAAG